MLELLETLRSLRDNGTTAQAAVRLRITQSAVSKRIRSLEERTGGPLVEPHGRRLRLTPLGEQLLAEATPLLVRLEEIFERKPVSLPTLVLGAPESLLASWLPKRLMSAAADLVSLELHVHRGPSLVERVRSGSLEVAICADAGSFPELSVRSLGEEPMGVILPEADDGVSPLDLWTIEESALTGQMLARRLPRISVGRPLQIVRRLESFAVLSQLGKAGLCAALVPEGIAIAMGVPAARFWRIPGLTRRLAMIGRPTMLARREVEQLIGRIGDPL